MGIASMGVLRPELVMKSIVPIVMAGVLGIYGLIISVIISTGSEWLPPSLMLLFLLSHGRCRTATDLPNCAALILFVHCCVATAACGKCSDSSSDHLGLAADIPLV